MNQRDGPLVSVGLPTRNRAHLLPTALRSLLNQTYRNMEFIVSDNASTDETEHVVLSLKEKDPRIRYIKQRENIGSIKNHEFVLKQSGGAYFMWASDDDSWDPRFVEKLVAVLEAHPDYGVAMSHYYQRLVTQKGEQISLREHYFTDKTYQKIYAMYLHQRGHLSPIFFFGLYRTLLLKSIVRRGLPISSQGPMVFLCEVALATRCYSVPEPLHTRLQNARSRIERHPDHPFALAERKPFALTHYLLFIFYWLLTSPVIPLSRKWLIVRPWISRVWIKKRKIGLEFTR